jgi:GT2 family glycosyltransferase
MLKAWVHLDAHGGGTLPEAASIETAPGASFIIPTYNRLEALKLCLARLEAQSCKDFEVIVVDDGSTDGTAEWVAQYLAATPLRLRVLRQANSGPAKARNAAIAVARAPLAIMIGDDILCTPGFAAEHMRFHREHPEPRFAALGLTRWSEALQTVTPFMRWMDASGAQFAYGDLLRGVRPEWRHFYTSNLSVKTELLRAYPFDERFTQGWWMMEDMELGYRLQVREKLQLTLLPEALAEHVHPTDFRKACRRAQGTGRSLRVFDALWPDRPRTQHGWMHGALKDVLCRNGWLLAPLTWCTERLTRVWCPNPLIAFTLAFHTEVARRGRPG